MSHLGVADCLRTVACCRRAHAQVSDQAVRLWQEGWFQDSAEPSGVSVLRNPRV